MCGVLESQGEVMHTPGPWRFEQSKGGRWYVYGACQKQPFKPNVYVPKNGGSQEAFANARLIAAAPEMYAALRAIQALLPEDVSLKIDILLSKVKE